MRLNQDVEERSLLTDFNLLEIEHHKSHSIHCILQTMEGVLLPEFPRHRNDTWLLPRTVERILVLQLADEAGSQLSYDLIYFFQNNSIG